MAESETKSAAEPYLEFLGGLANGYFNSKRPMPSAPQPEVAGAYNQNTGVNYAATGADAAMINTVNNTSVGGITVNKNILLATAAIVGVLGVVKVMS